MPSNFIQSNGIPLRIAACNCLLGMTRDMEDFVVADEQFTDWEGIVGASMRDPQHIVVGVNYVDNRDGTENDGFNDGATALCTILQPFQNYPEVVGSGQKPNLIIKARGKIKWKNGSPEFPAIKITLRPYKCELDYTYMGNFNKSGEGEVGYESSMERNGHFSYDDIWDTWQFEGEPTPNFYTDPVGNYTAQSKNQREAEKQFEERGKMITLTETHYFKNNDRPADEKTPWEAVPDWVPNPTLYPRAETGEPYNFKRNESYDFRYRFPSWWFEQSKNIIIGTERSSIYLPEINDGAGYVFFPAVEATPWVSQPVPTANVGIHDNPFFDENKEGIAPVIKGFYVDGQFPTTGGYKALASSTALKGYKYIRKRYSFSFSVSCPASQQLIVPDNTVGAVMVYYDPNYYGGIYSDRFQAFYVIPRAQDNIGSTQTFDCTTWWRMEISAPLAEWNWDEVEESGTKISGWIILNKKVCDVNPSSTIGVGGGVHSSNWWYGGGAYYSTAFYGFAGLSPITAGKKFDFTDKFGIELPAGEIPWSVTISKSNAKMKKDGTDVFVPFFDFPIGGSVWVDDGEGGYTEIRCGDPIENGASYISDFIVTDIELR